MHTIETIEAPGTEVRNIGRATNSKLFDLKRPEGRTSAAQNETARSELTKVLAEHQLNRTNMSPVVSFDRTLTREEAASCGLSRFYTGRLCKSGHLDERYVSNKQCVSCNAEKSKIRERMRCHNDPSYRMYRSVQRRSGQALSGRSSAAKALGCGHQKLRRHIENQFTNGMCWDKYGQWEVDHINPLAIGRSVREIVSLCNYSNLQPLWKRQNQMKGCQI